MDYNIGKKDKLVDHIYNNGKAVSIIEALADADILQIQTASKMFLEKSSVSCAVRCVVLLSHHENFLFDIDGLRITQILEDIVYRKYAKMKRTSAIL